MMTAVATRRSNHAFAAEKSPGLQPGAEAPTGRRLAIKVGRQTVTIPLSELRWIQAARNYLRLYTGADYHLLRETMSNLEAKLDPEQFIRIHRCTIVNRAFVCAVRHLDNGQSLVVLDDQTVLRLSRGYRQAVNRFPRLASATPSTVPWS
jgi:two-component system LytT family response regulator